MATQLACASFITPEDVTCDCQLTSSFTLEEIVENASDLLVQLTGGVFYGRCSVKVRPERTGYDCNPCTTDREWALPLPGPNPVVSEVKIDGETLAASEYTMMDDHLLVRVSSGTSPLYWPSTNHLWKPDTETGTWSITYVHGYDVDVAAHNATAEIACDLIDGLTGKSRLGQFVSSATMDGLTVSRQALDPDNVEEAGFSWVARVLRMFNPSSLSGVRSPELERGWKLHTLG